MLSIEEAGKIGIQACIDKLGIDFCKKHADNAVSSYGESDGLVKCFVGVDDAPAPDYDISNVKELFLTSGNDWPYYAFCDVDMQNGGIEYGECVLPDNR